MPKYHIQIIDTETMGQVDHIVTDGFVLLYLEQGKLKITGKIEFSELAPIILKVGLEKLMKK